VGTSVWQAALIGGSLTVREAPAVLPWDCAIPGVPASLQGSTTKRDDWKRRVAEEARRTWPSIRPPLTDPVAVTMLIFDVGQVGDIDNKIKFTLDALITIALANDDVVHQLTVARHDLLSPLRLLSPSPVLSGALDRLGSATNPFVYIRLTRTRALEELLT
jgi:Endodeoxyribonuclease RusA